VSTRELIVLGTSSQVPTRTRAHHGALLRFDGLGLLLDPGEGTQRQLTLAGVPSGSIDAVFITHAHGDHCLGLPGVLQRRSLDGIRRPVEVHHPHAAAPFVARLRHASAYEDVTDVRLRATGPGAVASDTLRDLRIRAAELSHRIPTLGWRFEEPDGWRMLPERLDALEVHGPDRERLRREGRLRRAGRTIHLEQVAVPRRGQRIAVVMDTRRCDGALQLAAEVDLLLIEATFLEAERDIAEVAGHLTAGQAARLAQDAGAHRVVLTHLSPRYAELTAHEAEARAAAPQLDLTVARDLDRFTLRRAPG